MRKWAFFVVAAAVVVIGCGGSGDNGGAVTNGGNGGDTGGGDLRVAIPTPPGQLYPYGTIEFSYLSGQGRAIGDLVLNINRIDIADEYGNVRTDLNDHVSIALHRHTFQTIRMNVPFTGQNSRLFQSYVLEPHSVVEEVAGGSTRTIERFGVEEGGGTFSFRWPPRPLSMSARVFPGRSTSVPILIDDSMFRIANDGTGSPVVVFDEARFDVVNQPPVQGFLNDYVMFDISGIPSNERPNMETAGGALQSVTRVFFSGDNFAVAGPQDRGEFHVLTPEVAEPIEGTFASPGVIGDRERPGTFTLEQLDPTDLENLRKIVALQGMWRPASSVLSGFGTWNFLTFPTSNDGPRQEAVLFRQVGGQITAMYFGEVRLDTNEFELFPIRTLVSGIVDNDDVVTGRITAQFDRHGSITGVAQGTRSGIFEITTRAQLPSDAPASGRFIVFRI